MPERPGIRAALAAIVSLVGAAVAAQTVITEGTNLSVDVAPDRQHLAIDLLGSIWVMPASGGQAEVVSDGLLPASRPRWSPDGSQMLYQTNSPDGSRIRLLELATNGSRALTPDPWHDQQAEWHPDGERIVFSSDRRDTGLDLWETDISTGLSWRLSDHAGDETEPVWSANGRHLAWIRRHGDTWSLILRRHGAPDAEIVSAAERLSSPSWRPDGTLLTFLRHGASETILEIAILSDPPLVRTYAVGEDFFASPVSWVDRRQMYYTADGTVKSRDFEARAPRQVFFRASVGDGDARTTIAATNRELPVNSAPVGRFVIRGARLFDGVGDIYLEGLDILIDGPRIVAIEARREWPDATVLDPGNVTVMPGFIDIYARMPADGLPQNGAALLAYGLTTIVTDEQPADFDPVSWDSDASPGPRVLPAASLQSAVMDDDEPYLITLPPDSSLGDTGRSVVREWQRRGVPVLAENWTVGLGMGADLLLGAGTLPASPQGRRYDDVRHAAGEVPLTFVSGLADAGTPGIENIRNARQTLALGYELLPPRRFAAMPQLANNRSSIVLGSKSNGLPSGPALHAELVALASAGLGSADVLRAAGAHAATALGLGAQIGLIRPGALADLVLVSGDPLADPADSLRIVAVVRNGRFYSLGRLLDLATAAVEHQASVE